MNEEDVTHVTRNHRHVPEEVKLLIDLAASAAMFYYVTHPECIDEITTYVKRKWTQFVHAVSVWNTQQEIRNLPETETEPPGES